MSSVERNSIQPNGQLQRGNQHRNPSDRSLPTLIWILRILIVLFLLDRNLNQTLAMKRAIDSRVPYQPIFNEAGVEKARVHYFVLNMYWPVTRCARSLTEKFRLPEQFASLENEVLDCRDTLNELRESHEDNKFKIHGLWPNDAREPFGKGGVFNCPGEKYDRNKVEALDGQGLLSSYWPDVIWRTDKSKNHVFWIYEWEKHGKCAAKIQAIGNRDNYFRRTVNLAVSLDDIQEGASLLLTRTGRFDEFWVDLHALESFYKFRFREVKINWHVVNVLPRSTKENWIESISFCFDLNLEPRDCPTKEPQSHQDLQSAQLRQGSQHFNVQPLPPALPLKFPSIQSLNRLRLP